jgi:hypothetical protein
LRATVPGEGPDILHGWKEIAAHLGRSVRSAQRWEATLGLPVKRISTPDGGQIISASRVELDEWQRQTAVRREADDQLEAVESDDEVSEAIGLASRPADVEARAPTDQVSTADRRMPTSALRRVAPRAGLRVAQATLLLVTLAAGILGGIWLVTTAIPAWSTPIEFAVEGSAVVARNASGRPVWTHALSQSAHRPPDVQPGSGAVMGDLDGDRALEVALPVALAPARTVPATTDVVLVFEKTGRLRWKIQPALRVFDGGTAFDGPWRIQALAFSSAPPGRLWIAYGHHTSHPAFVLEVSSRGAQSIRYLVSGRIFALAHWRTGTGDYLAAGGADRQQQSASITLLDLNAPSARWPMNGAGLTCAGCPTGSPRALALFPNSDVTRADFRTFGWVYAMRQSSPDRLTLVMTNGSGPVGPDTTAVTRSDLTIAELARTEEHWAKHRAYEAAGRILHSVDECPDAMTPVLVRRWTPESGWAAQAVAHAARPPLRGEGGRALAD